MAETYKLLRGYYKTDPNSLFSLAGNNLRGHSLKLTKQRFQKDPRRYFFANRVIDDWNSLPKEFVSAPTLSQFKEKLRSLPDLWRDNSTK